MKIIKISKHTINIFIIASECNQKIVKYSRSYCKHSYHLTFTRVVFEKKNLRMSHLHKVRLSLSLKKRIRFYEVLIRMIMHLEENKEAFIINRYINRTNKHIKYRRII